MQRWQHHLQQQATPVIKAAGRFLLLAGLNYGAAGLAAKAVKNRPLKILLASALEPALQHLIRRIAEKK